MILIVLIAGIFIGKYVFSEKKDNSVVKENQDPPFQEKEQSSREATYSKNRESSYPPGKHLRPFNPNTADSSLLIEIGLSPYVTHNIIKYRQKGGKFHQAKDLQKIYGINPDQAKELEVYVKLETIKDQSPTEIKEQGQAYHQTSTPKINDNPSYTTREYSKTEKHKSGTTVNINTADTAELKKIPGIGSSFANRIVKYRLILGGFYCLDQIKEVYGIDEEKYHQIQPWLKVEKDPLQLISVNKSSLDKLKSHPYVNFYQAKAIIELRKKQGKLNNLGELSLMEEFSATDLERLKYYLSFD